MNLEKIGNDMSEKKEEKFEISGTDGDKVKALSDSEFDNILNTDEITDTPIADIEVDLEVDLEGDNDFIVDDTVLEDVVVDDTVIPNVVVDEPVAENAVPIDALADVPVTESVVEDATPIDVFVDEPVDSFEELGDVEVAVIAEDSSDDVLVDDEFEDETISISNSDLNRILQETETVEDEIDAVSLDTEVVDELEPVVEKNMDPMGIEDSIVELSSDELDSEDSGESVLIGLKDKIISAEEPPSDEIVFEEMTVESDKQSGQELDKNLGLMTGEVPLQDAGVGEPFIEDSLGDGVSDEIIIPSELDDDSIMESSAFSENESKIVESVTTVDETIVLDDEVISLDDIGEPSVSVEEEVISLDDVSEPSVSVEEEVISLDDVSEPAVMVEEEVITIDDGLSHEPANEEIIIFDEEVGSEEVITTSADKVKAEEVSSGIEIIDNLDLEDENEEIVDEESIFTEDETISVSSEVESTDDSISLELDNVLPESVESNEDVSEEPIAVDMGVYMGSEPAIARDVLLEEEMVEADIFSEGNEDVSDDFSEDEISEMHEEIFSQHESIPEVIETAPTPVVASIPVPVSESIAPPEIVQGLTDETKQDVKTVLSYLDNLFDDLPDDKVKEFASSEYYDIYNRLFKKLGI